MGLTLEQFDNAGVGEVSSMLAEIRATIVERDEARANLATRDEYLTGIIAGLDCDDGCGCGKHHCVLDEEAECVTCRLTRERDEARAEVEKLKAGIEAGLEEQSLNWHKFTALGETKHRAALEALRERCVAAVEFSLAGFSCVCSFRAAEAVRAVSLEEP